MKPHQTDKGEYVSRAALKLDSVAKRLQLDFADKIVLDVGSSTGGFTQFALLNGSNKVIAVEVGTNQMEAKLKLDPRVELHEKTDIRVFKTEQPIDLVVIDVSFVSLRLILPAVADLVKSDCEIVAMVKPQFEAGDEFKNKGIVKNEKLRRQILKDFEDWAKRYFVIIDKADSAVSGVGGNLERFYLLRKT